MSATPWHIAESDQCPASKPYAVIKDDDGEIEGCHPSKEAAKKQLAALNASERAMPTEHRPVQELEYRFGTEGPEVTGAFTGYGTLWNITDTYGTRFAPGSFVAGGLDDKPYALLWMHDPTQVVGVFEAKEDERGLKIDGQFATTPRGQEARVLAQMGGAPGLSVGFVRQQGREDDPDSIISARLVEVSLITARMAAVPGAGMVLVRDDRAAELSRRRKIERVRLGFTAPK